MSRIYLDYAATTPVDSKVLRAMESYFCKDFGNAGSLHGFGQEASGAVFRAREIIASALGCSYKEIIFTGSATEANNLAIRGAVRSAMLGLSLRASAKQSQVEDKIASSTTEVWPRNDRAWKPRIIVSAIEHESILATVRDLELDGVEVVYIPVSQNGIVDLKKLAAALNERTVLVSVMYANNEIGTIQPIQEISKIIQDFRQDFRKHTVRLRSSRVAGRTLRTDVGGDDPRPAYRQAGPACRQAGPAICDWPLFHTDAVQAFQYLPCRVNELGVDLLTLSAHKIYGPKGIGLLYNRQSAKHKASLPVGMAQSAQGERSVFSDLPAGRQDLRLAPIITGGGQERGLRAGTENVPFIVGFAKAVEIVERLRVTETVRVKKLRDYFLKRLRVVAPRVALNGSLFERLPNNMNIYIPGSTAGDLLIALDMRGVAVSPGSACHARVCSPSHVLRAIGCDDRRASSSLRFSFGRHTTRVVVDKTIAVIKNILKKK